MLLYKAVELGCSLKTGILINNVGYTGIPVQTVELITMFRKQGYLVQSVSSDRFDADHKTVWNLILIKNLDLDLYTLP